MARPPSPIGETLANTGGRDKGEGKTGGRLGHTKWGHYNLYLLPPVGLPLRRRPHIQNLANIEMHGGMVGSVDSVTEDRVGEAADDDEAVTGEA